jgi:hypothetical protein
VVLAIIHAHGSKLPSAAMAQGGVNPLWSGCGLFCLLHVMRDSVSQSGHKSVLQTKAAVVINAASEWQRLA